jgi:hypothetical protein
MNSAPAHFIPTFAIYFQTRYTFIRKVFLIRLFSVDFNVPMEGDKITSNQRIVAAIPTIEYCLKQGNLIFFMNGSDLTLLFQAPRALF